MKSTVRPVMAIGAIAAILIAACGETDDGDAGSGTAPDGTEEQVTLRIGGSGPGSSGFIAHGAIAEYFNTRSGVDHVRLNNQATGGNIEGLRLLVNDEIDMIHTNIQPYVEATTATGPFEGEDPEPFKDVMLMFPVWTTPVGWYTYDESIATIADLVGKRANIGPPGSGIATFSSAVLEAADIFDQVQIERQDPNEATRLLIDGLIDAVGSSGPPPVPSIVELAAGGDLKFIEMGQEVIDRATADSAYGPQVIPADTYGPGVPKVDYNTFGDSAYLAVHSRFPEDLVYDILEVLVEPAAHEYLRDQWAGFGLVLNDDFNPGFEAMLSGGALLHPGAVRFWQDQGYDVPPELIP